MASLLGIEQKYGEPLQDFLMGFNEARLHTKVLATLVNVVRHTHLALYGQAKTNLFGRTPRAHIAEKNSKMVFKIMTPEGLGNPLTEDETNGKDDGAYEMVSR